MIITIICLTMLIIGIICGIIHCRIGWEDEIFQVISRLFGVIGGMTTFICVLAIIMVNTGVNAEIYKIQEEHSGLQKQVEIVNSDYEDMSKTKVIKRATEWNVTVYEAKYWGRNKFTNWFFNDDVVNAYEYIKIE